MASREVRDAVHGLIELTPQEWKVVDSPAFQRLRGIQQLAATHLVYPGARHSRFEHCLGACHLAGRLADRLGLSDEAGRSVRLAALLHDVGHGPFSQVAESVFDHLTGRSHVHEEITVAVTRFHEPIRSALGDDANRIAELLSDPSTAVPTAARDIISGPVDVDKMDYLLRDSHFCGVEYGRFDIDKVVESARVVEGADGKRMAFHEDGLFAVEGLMLARYQMHRQVYGHKTRVATDQMLERAIVLGVEEGLLPKRIFAPTQVDAKYVDEYVEWDDHRTLAALSAGGDSPAGQMTRALTERRLMKRLLQVELTDLRVADGEPLAEASVVTGHRALEAQRPAVERRIAELLGLDPMWVALHFDSAELPNADVPITNNCPGVIKRFGDLSKILSSGRPRPAGTVTVYAQPRPSGDETSTWDQTVLREAVISGLHVTSGA